MNGWVGVRKYRVSRPRTSVGGKARRRALRRAVAFPVVTTLLLRRAVLISTLLHMRRAVLVGARWRSVRGCVCWR